MDIKKLLNKKKITGEEVGKALIIESIYTHQATIEGKPANELFIFTKEERDRMVDGIDTEKDFIMYSTYRAIDDIIKRNSLLLQAGIQGAYNGYFRLASFFSFAFNSQKALETVESLPVIMTEKQYKKEIKNYDRATGFTLGEKQYKEERKRQGESFKHKNGVAIIQDPDPSRLDEKGYYKTPIDLNDKIYGGFKALFDDEEQKHYIEYARAMNLITSFRIAITINTFFDLLAERLKIEDIKVFRISDTETIKESVKTLNELIDKSFQYHVEHIENEQEKERLKTLVKEVFPPIDLSLYEPTPKAIDEAKKLLKDIKKIKANETRIYDTLKGGAIDE